MLGEHATRVQPLRKRGRVRQPRSFWSGCRFQILATGGVVVALGYCLRSAVSAFVAGSFTGSSSGRQSRGQEVIRHSYTQIEEKLRRPSLASEWRLNVGRAIDVLRVDTVALFEENDQHVPDLSIFDENIEILDARMPSFQLRGLQTYQQVLASLRWWVRSSCDTSDATITSVSPPVNNEVYMRWRLTLLPKDVIASATGFLAPWGMASSLRNMGLGPGLPFIIEGYSKYEFHPWSGKIVKHTIDITNPPIAILDLIRKYAQAPSAWLTPVHNGVGIPTAARATPLATVATKSLGASTAAAVPSSTLTGSSAGRSGRTVQRQRRGVGLFGLLPQTCDDDFECNDGKANFPLQCCDVPILGKFCCQPDDYEPAPTQPAYVPIPVPVEDPPQN
eukprot:TRINITY_DN75220_c0_g1_i1.p1 TRINITY_DN75220_c0_g1~~TRINITY_DN75220_c0_g1_i1.p1  ORF type:complete len:391 (+),score=61.97 TRINITY_DN75220_c0_g1_i1:115-1287(+)